MPRRLHATPADYVIVAINPALIMLLIGSLVYFLLEMLYQGQYPARLHYCLTWYVFGAVLVSRISMEEGWDRAAPLGIALAVVMVLALHRFVSYDGTSLASVGWLINYALIGLISWCAHKLTWDCTLIDDSQDASGEGLLQTAKLDLQEPKPAPVDQKSAKAKAKRAAKEAAATLPMAAVETAKSAAIDRAYGKNTKKSWWQQFVERRRRPHAPGVWIVYFSLAALPLFGFGQVLIPTANAGSRRYAFLLLTIYVACGLGLLLTTSFLGLRRYLRQRKLEMPPAMTGAWLTTGAVLIVILLLFSALLPRPNAEYAISQLPTFTSSEHDSSQLSVGKEGTKDDQANSAPGKRTRPDIEPSQDPNAKSNGTEPNSNSPQGGQPGQNKNQQRKENKSESKNGAGNQRDSTQSPNDTSPNSQPSNEQSSEPQNPFDPPADQNSAERNTEQSDHQDLNKDSSETKSDGSQQSGEQQNDSEHSASKSEQQPDTSGEPNSSAPSSTTPPPPDFTAIAEPIAAAFKWLFYGVVIAGAVWWAWHNWQLIVAWLHYLLTFWQNLFGGPQRKALPVTLELGPVYQPFSAYTDPFASGQAGRYSAEALVRYSFEALEAWARDQGWPRESDQTAYEFARQVGTQAPPIAAPARALADLYSRAAYASAALPANSIEQLQTLWQAMSVPQFVA